MSKKTIGIWLSGIGPSQLALETVSSANRAVGAGHDVILFLNNIYPPVLEPKCVCMSPAEIFDFPGVVVATSLELAHKLLSMPGPKEKHYYIHDLDWLRGPNRNYEAFASIYQNEKLGLITRSNEYSKIIKNVWGRHTKVVAQGDFVGDLFKYL